MIFVLISEKVNDNHCRNTLTCIEDKKKSGNKLLLNQERSGSYLLSRLLK